MFSRSSAIPQWVADLEQRRMLDANDAALEFWRMTREQFLTGGVERFFHADELTRWENYIADGKWGETGPWKCRRGDGTIFCCTIRWQMIDYNGEQCAFVFPLRAGDSPTSMLDLEFKEPRKQSASSSDGP